MEDKRAAELRSLPQVDRLLSFLGDSAGSRSMAVSATRTVLDEARLAILNGEPATSIDTLVARIRLLLEGSKRRRLTPVINATGVLLHTNLGRAPLSAEAINAVDKTGAGYSNLEYDISAGSRGSRYDFAAGMLTTLTGAESALVVNNNAAAVLLVLAGLTANKEVVISRGELIEIGGGFRIPEILAESGALLREVGTTNRTHLSDYETAIGPQTAAIMKVHPSNYRVVGFASAVPARELVALAVAHGLAFIHDLGSGLIRHEVGGREVPWLRDEPTALDAVEEGADVVTFSGDKLLGGPQAGIILGRSRHIEKLRRSPLVRALRPDKMTLSALEATLLAYLEDREADLPIWRMALADSPELERRALRLASELAGLEAKVEVVKGFSTAGGGSAPGAQIPTMVLQISPSGKSPNEVVRELIDNDPPVIARISGDNLIIDVRTVAGNQDDTLASALRSSLPT